MSKDNPWLKFWPQDWQRDPALRSCGLAARGLWMEMICIAHDGEPYGHVTINGRAASPRQIASIVGITEREAVKLIAELEDAGVFNRTEGGMIYSRRMVRDKAEREKFREMGKRGGNPSLKGNSNPPDMPDDKGGVNPYPKHLEAEAEAEAREERKTPASPSSRAKPDPRGSRLPDGWQPGAEDADFAVSLGLSPEAVAAGFGDYWRGKAGSSARKVDWSATFRNWCREEARRKRPVFGQKPNAMDERLRGMGLLAGADAFRTIDGEAA